MTRETYIEQLLQTYRLVRVLADRNDCLTLQLRHRTLERDIVVHSFPEEVSAYRVLCDVLCDSLPVVYDSVLLDDGQVVLEEFIRGITVEQMMECHRYTYREAKRVVQSVLTALTVLHENGLVHRDVKPSNVMLGDDGRTVLIDFNIARRSSPVKSKDTAVMGTVGYVSPEQLGVTQSDARTDIYAVGVCLNVMITGKHPSEELAKGKAGNIVRKCTNINPNERYQTAKDLQLAL